MTPDAAIAALRAEADPALAAREAAQLTTPREVIGLRVPRITELATAWRQDLSLDDRLALADGLWRAGLHESRIAAVKLLVQARIRPDDRGAWDLITAWVPEVDDWGIADHVADAGARRLSADPARLDQLEAWIGSDHMWTRRAALVMTLPWTRMNNPKPAELAIRERVLAWAEALLSDRDPQIQAAIAWWLRELSKHDAPRARAFLEEHGHALSRGARNEAAKHLDPKPVYRMPAPQDPAPAGGADDEDDGWDDEDWGEEDWGDEDDTGDEIKGGDGDK